LNFNQIYQKIWQEKAYRTVLKKNIDIDVVHVYSLSDFRQPGKWYKLKNAYCILGPVGGGQICPPALKRYDDIKGRIREFVNIIYKYNPIYKRKIEKYDKVYTCNKETQEYLKKSKRMPDVPLNDNFRNLKINNRNNSVITILFIGRLIKKKGVLFLLDALEFLERDHVPYQLFIYGDGEEKENIKNTVIAKKLSKKVFIKGKAPYKEMSKIYRRGDIFVLPSLRESGGSVLVEAMAHKLPVVALDMALSRLLNEKECGLFVDIHQNKEAILRQFADMLKSLIQQPELRNYYGENGYRYVNAELTWENMIQEVYGKLLNRK
jgi:glycosyltransferase involved in cell wall biosynthesis